MSPSQALLILLLLAAGVSSKPIVSRDAPRVILPFATKRGTARNGGLNMADAGRERAKALRAQANANANANGRRDDASVDVSNSGVTYVASVGVGSPATQYNLLVDTGSSNTWVGADAGYTPTSTSQDTGNAVHVSYGSGSFSGEEYTDTVTLASGLIITSQSIGVASSSAGFDGVDGILGIGPVDLTSGTVSDTDAVPTVMDNLLSQGTISSEVIGVYYAPAAGSDSSGEITFGGADSGKYTGDIAYADVTATSPASEYWGVDQAVSYGGSEILSSTSGIVDTGTTLVLLATEAFEAYQEATGATLDSATGLLAISSSQYAALGALDFSIGGSTFSLTPNAQIWPRSLNADIGGSEDVIYLVVADTGSGSGSGLDFVDGYAFLERFYSVFDTANSRVGFAATLYTDSTSN